MAVLSSLGVRADPVLNHNFLITLLDTSSGLALAKSIAMAAVLDVAVGGFSECMGLDMSLQVEDYKEGGNNGTILKFPTRVSWTNITLKKGVGLTNTLWNWHYGFVEGTGKRRDGLIVLLNELRVPNNIWYFRRGLPFKYSGPTMNATQNSVAIEAIEIAHEGLYQVPAIGLIGGAASIAAGVIA